MTKQLRGVERFSTVALTVLVLFVIPACALAAAFTPDSVRTFLDGNAMIIMFVWGLIHTRWPALSNVPNALIPWVNLVGYVLVHFFLPAPASASIGGAITSFASLVWVAARGGATSAVTSLLYDKYVGPFLDKWWPKAA
jgi:hypothetical protein